MDEALIMQFRRGSKRLQVVVLPWAGKYSVAALIRVWDRHMTDAVHGWRYFPAHTMSITLALGEDDRYVADAGVEEIMQSEWIKNGAVLEIRERFQLEADEAAHLRTNNVPKNLFKRLADEVDNWV